MRYYVLTFAIIFSVIVIAHSTVSFFAFPIKYKSTIQSVALEYDLAPEFICAVIKAESNFKPTAVSQKGAIGLMQVLPSTADFIVRKENLPTTYDLGNPTDNIRIGACYLRYLFDRFNDERTVLSAYNAGEGNVAKWLGERRTIEKTPFPETNAYVDRVLNAKKFYKNRF